MSSYDEDDEEPRRYEPSPPPACQGCTEITGSMTYCQDLCIGLQNWDDVEERAREYRASQPPATPGSVGSPN